MEILTAAPAGRIRAGASIRKALSWAVLPCLAIGLLLGCASHTGMPLIVINSFTPAQGPAGTLVTITGAGLSNVSFLSVGEGAVPEYVIVGPNQINFTVPSTATTGLLTLNDSQDNQTSATPFTVTPQIVGLAPTSGPAGTEVKVTGGGFVGTTQVLFSGEPATGAGSAFFVVGANQINTFVGSDATTGPVQVVVGATTVAGPVFTVTTP
jgi:hypothetical protein